MLGSDRRTWYLRQVDLFRGLTGPQIATLAAAFETRTYAPGEPIVSPGLLEERVFLVRKGAVRLFHRGPTGREVTADVVGPGRLFGVSTFFGPAQDGLLAEAITETTIHTAQGGEFLRLVWQWPTVLCNLVAQVGAQIVQTERRLDRLVAVDARGRLAAVLHRLAGDAGEEDAQGGRRITTVLTHEALGRQIGCARETVTRLLGALEAEGHIRRRGRHLVVCDPRRLATLFDGDVADGAADAAW
jgi:CRP-like cAMP-binding protein